MRNFFGEIYQKLKSTGTDFPSIADTAARRLRKKGKPWFICINDWLEKAGSAFALSTLLHEQIHVKHGRAAHGPAFQKEKRRLIRAGAFDDLI